MNAMNVSFPRKHWNSLKHFTIMTNAIWFDLKQAFQTLWAIAGSVIVVQARRKQLESDAPKTKEILKTPQQKGFYFFISKSLILAGKKKCGESQCCRNVVAFIKWEAVCSNTVRLSTVFIYLSKSNSRACQS